MQSWDTFHHDADVGVRGRGGTLDEAFAQAAIALTSVITDPARVRCRDVIRVHCKAADPELLFLDWINALVYEMATRKMLLADFSVKITRGELEASACGEPVDAARHEPAVEVKGATFTELKVRRDATGSWVAQCVVDV